MSEQVARNVGNFIRSFIESYPNNFSGFWQYYLRVRDSLDVRQHLKRRMKIKLFDTEWSWANFKYEKLLSFFFLCGILGHVHKLFYY